ncbi:MAG: alpha/beta fold hydrolase [Methylibium sp.]
MPLKFELAGHGPHKVLVTHNWMASIRSYDAVRPLLDEAAFTYAFVDLRGYGLNHDVHGEHSAREAARDLIKVADGLDWERFSVVGHSMSGMIAQRVGVDARERVRALVCVTPVAASGMPLDAPSRTMFAAAATSEAQWTAIAKMLTSSRLPERWYAAQFRQFRGTVRPEAALGYLEMFAGSDFSAEMTDLTMPALAILGRHDFSAFGEESIRQTLPRWLPALQVEVIDSAGHHPMLETPPLFVATLERFLAANG